MSSPPSREGGRRGRGGSQGDKFQLSSIPSTPVRFSTPARLGSPSSVTRGSPTSSSGRPRSATSLSALSPWVPAGCARACSPASPCSSPVSPSGHQYRFRLFPKKPHPLQLLAAGSKSSPTLLLGYDPGPHPPKVWSEEEKHWRRVALSPHGLFARNVPSDMDWGSTAGHRFYELGMQDRRGGSSPSHRQPSASLSAREESPRPEARMESPPMSPSRTRSSQAAATPEAMTLSNEAREAGWKAVQEGKDLYDIRQGFRVAALELPPLALSAEKIWPPPKKERLPATRLETMKVYQAFLRMLEMDGKTVWRKEVLGEDEVSGQELFRAGVGMSTVSWRKLLFWVETGGFGLDVRTRCVYEALHKALKGYHRGLSQEERDKDVSLSMLFKWIWPFVGHRRMVEMFSWICQYECECMRLPDPPLISEKERRDMTRLYYKMDLDGKGYCVPLDLAGGDHTDWQVQLANTVDEATVKEVLGDRVIPLEEFLELMCEDGYRGSPEATKAILKDGRHVVLHVRESVGWQGWVYAEAPPEQQEALRRIDAVEAEVMHWQMQASRRALKSATSRASSASGAA